MKVGLLFGSSMLFLANSATAQTRPADDQSGVAQSAELRESTPSDQGAGDPASGDIVVTAQRRSQFAREVPLALSAIGERELEVLKIENVTSLVSSVPGISGAYQGVLQPFVVIRGISSNSVGIGGEASVGIFVDEAYIGRISAQSVPFLDVDRVEVLRGPQGSLYGRNSTAGAISIITRKPVPGTTDLDLGASYGSFESYEATGAGSFSLSDNAAVRLAVLARGTDGYDFNVATGRDDQSARVEAGRLSFAFVPSDTLRLDLSGTYSNERAGTLPFKTTVPDLAAAGGVDVDPFSGRFATSFNGNEKRRATGANLTVAWDASDSVTLKSVSSYNNVKFSGLYDIDGSVLPLQELRFSGGRVETFGQEFRFTGEIGPLRLQAGGNIFLEQVRQDTSLTYDENLVLPLAAGGIFGTPDGSIPADVLFPGSPSFIPCDAASVDLLGVACSARQFEVTRQSGKYRSYAAFVEAEIELAPTLTLTAGGRYSIDRKRFRYNTPLIVSQGAALVGTNPLLQASTAGTLAQRNTWRDFQPRAVLRWQPNDDLNIYGSVTRGFKSGGFDPSSRNGIYDADQTEFDPESVFSYEVGIKSTLLDRRLQLNVAAFRYNYKNFQVQVLRDGITSTLNVPQYNAFGVEADATFRPSRLLTVTLGGSWNSAEYGNFVVDDRFNPGQQQNLSGNRGILSPEFSGFARADWVIPFSDRFQFRAAGDVNWRSRQFFTIFGDAREAQAAYALVSGQLGIETEDERYSLAVNVQNVFNQDYLTSAVEQGFGISTFRGRPRSVSLTLRAKY